MVLHVAIGEVKVRSEDSETIQVARLSSKAKRIGM